MANYPRDPYSVIDAVGIIPDGAANLWAAMALPDGLGVYEFHGLTAIRTAGVASASLTPILGLVDASTGLDIVDRFVTTAYQVLPAGSGIFLPSAIRFFTPITPEVFIALQPNVLAGDTFSIRLRVKRIF